MKSKTFANGWDALEDNPAAATMTMRSNVALTDTVRAWNLTQAKAARRLGITQTASQRPAARPDRQILARHAADARNPRRP